MLGLYVHVPFCSAICNYCNFNRGLFDGALKARYVEALVAEIERAGEAGMAGMAAGERLRPRRAEDKQIRGEASASVRAGGGAPAPVEEKWDSADTIYFGGGTPSLLEPHEIGRIIGACRASFDLAGDSEITLEANPESVDRARLEGFRAAGVNRLSFGVQSFRDAELRRLSRLHTADRARAAVGEARAAGFDNLSLDLMMWLPGQQVAQWLESVDASIALGPDHLSLYMLEVYPNAPLRDEMARAKWSQAPDEDVAAMYVTAMERLETAGYEQYRDLQRGSPRTAIAAQPEILVRRGVARLRLRRALDPRGCPVEKCRVHRGVRQSGGGCSVAWNGPPAALDRGASG